MTCITEYRQLNAMHVYSQSIRLSKAISFYCKVLFGIADTAEYLKPTSNFRWPVSNCIIISNEAILLLLLFDSVIIVILFQSRVSDFCVIICCELRFWGF